MHTNEMDLSRQAQDAAVRAAPANLADGHVGFFSYGDGPPAAGGGVGAFLWFATRDELLIFLGTHLVHFSPGPASADTASVAANVSAIVARMARGELAGDAAIAELNTALRRFSQIEWIGSLGDLRRGTREFERKVRRWYNDDESDAPIADANVGTFADQLQQYGL